MSRRPAIAVVFLLLASLAATASAQAPGKAPGDEFVGYWTIDLHRWGLVETWTISRTKDELSVSGKYLRGGMEVGSWVGHNPAVADGVLKFEKQLLRKPISAWHDASSQVTAKIEKGLLRGKWTAPHGSGEFALTRQGDAPPAVATTPPIKPDTPAKPPANSPPTPAQPAPAEGTFVGNWTGMTGGYQINWTIAKEQGKWTVEGVYDNFGRRAGAWRGKNVELKNGSLEFIQEYSQRPAHFTDQMLITVTTASGGRIKYSWRNGNESGGTFLTRVFGNPNVAQNVAPAQPAPTSTAIVRPNLPGPARPPSPFLSSSRPSLPESTDVPGFSGWLQSLDIAKQRAAEQKQDILVVFEGSQLSKTSTQMAKEIFSNPAFLNRARQRFVLVVVGFPSGSKSAGDRQKLAILRQYGVERLPTVALLDSVGTPYAVHGFFDKGADEYGKQLDKLAANHALRDNLIAQVKQGTDAGQQLAAAEKALTFLCSQTFPRSELTEETSERFLAEFNSLGLAKFYPEQLQEWVRLARQHDPKNAQGKLELFFDVDWRTRLEKATEAAERETIVKRLDAWNKQFKFQDQDRAALLHLQASMVMRKLDNTDESFRFLDEATKFKPKNPKLSIFLGIIAKVLKAVEQISSGTGFMVDARGYVLTNQHVIEGPGKLVIRRPDTGEEVPAEVVAEDEDQDIALLKVDPKKFASFKPLPITATSVGRGSRVAMFGFPLGDAIGKGLKFSQGSISGLPEESNDFMLLIDGRVNPGNSGGPLCNTKGHVVGMITAKSAAGDGLDSYGMAIPSATLHAFLKQHLPGYKVPEGPTSGVNLEWDAVDRLVSHGVLMILKLRR